MNYLTTITGFGDLYEEFLDQDMIVIFNEGAPPELAELSMMHTRCELSQDVKPGDKVILGNKTYVVTEVGGEANSTLKDLGHCCLMFKPQDDQLLPGQIVLKGDGLPDVKIGDKFEIHFQ